MPGRRRKDKGGCRGEEAAVTRYPDISVIEIYPCPHKREPSFISAFLNAEEQAVERDVGLFESQPSKMPSLRHRCH